MTFHRDIPWQLKKKHEEVIALEQAWWQKKNVGGDILWSHGVAFQSADFVDEWPKEDAGEVAEDAGEVADAEEEREPMC